MGDEGSVRSSRGNRDRQGKLRAILARKRTGGRRRITSYRRSHGRLADTETCDLKGKLAVDHIGSLLPDDKRNGSMEAAVQLMLQKGPAFRVRSWVWPGTTATHGGASKVPQSSSNPVPKKTRTGARTFGEIGQRLDTSRSFDWYVRKADLRFTR
ncbi:unnamed protein product [Ectocarpus sp. 6 AP-2014]